MPNVNLSPFSIQIWPEPVPSSSDQQLDWDAMMADESEGQLVPLHIHGPMAEMAKISWEIARLVGIISDDELRTYI